MSREGTSQSKLFKDELTRKLEPKKITLKKKKKKEENKIQEVPFEVTGSKAETEEPNYLNVERPKKSIPGVRFLKNKKKEEDDMIRIEVRESEAEETNHLNVERQKKSISMFSGIYHSTISIPLRKDKDVSNNAELLVIVAFSSSFKLP